MFSLINSGSIGVNTLGEETERKRYRKTTDMCNIFGLYIF